MAAAPVAVARGAHLAGVEQRPFVPGWPPAPGAVAAPEVCPGDPAVLAAQPSDDLAPYVGAQVLEGRAGHAGPEIRAPAWQHPVQLDEQVIERHSGACPAAGADDHRIPYLGARRDQVIPYPLDQLFP